MRALHGHPKQLTLLAYAIAAAAVAAFAVTWGARRFIDAWGHPEPKWLIIVAGGAIVAQLAYIVSYRSLMRFDGGPRLTLVEAIGIVTHGFGPFVPAGGFDVDKRAIEGLHGDSNEAGLRVFAIGAMELAVLAPMACVCAIVIIIQGSHSRTEDTVLYPWAICVPAGFIIGFALIDRLRRRADADASGLRGLWGRAVQGAWMLADLSRQPLHGWPALLGMAAYWVADIASLYGAIHCLGVHLSPERTAVAYATGYALTRRSLPLGGAGVTEVLMTLALHWMSVPIPTALAVVVVYRLFNLVLPALPALWAHGRVFGMFSAAYGDGGSAEAAPAVNPASNP